MSNKLKIKYKKDFTELRRLINSWNFIPDSPLDEFDSLNHLILSILNKEGDEFKLTKSVHHELTINYGISIGIEESAEFVKDVKNWWMNDK